MKKIVAILAVICLLFAGTLTYLQIQSKRSVMTEDIPVAAENNDTEEMTETTDMQSHAPDFEAMYKLYPSDEVVMNVNGRDITWQEYYYWFYYYTQQISDSMDMMEMYYGQQTAWDDSASETDDIKYSDLPMMYVEDQLKQVETIYGYAVDNGIELTKEDLNNYNSILEADMESVCGEDGTIEDFYDLLDEMYMNIDIYKHMNEVSLFYERSMIDLYGENGKKISDEEALEYLNENGYMSAIHILLLTSDSATGESVDEDTKIKLEQQANKISEELKAISEDEARLARMKELIAEYNEDPGMQTYPDGYTFTSGTMVSEFETAIQALQDYEVSDPVETSYGYHIIMRMPLKADAVLTESSGESYAKELLATEKYTDALNEYYESVDVEYNDGFKAPAISDYINK